MLVIINKTIFWEIVVIYTFTRSVCLFHIALSKLVTINLKSCFFEGEKYLVIDRNCIELCQCIHVSLKLIIIEDFSYENWKAWPWCGDGLRYAVSWAGVLHEALWVSEQIDVRWAAGDNAELGHQPCQGADTRSSDCYSLGGIEGLPHCLWLWVSWGS